METTPPQNANRTHRDIPGLDGLRAIAIVFVLLAHCSTGFPETTPGWKMEILRNLGNQGVNLFFCLSGFLITRLLCVEYGKAGKIDLKRFYQRRAIRILPPALVFLVVVAILNVTGLVFVHWKDLLSALLFFKNYLPHSAMAPGDHIVGHFWTLSFEEHFYLIFPLAMALFGPARLRKYAWLGVLAAPFVRIASYYLIPAWRTYIIFHSHTNYDRFLWGCLLALCQYQNPDFSPSKFLKGSIAFVLFFFAATQILPVFDKNVGGWYEFPIGISLHSVIFCVIVDWATRNPLTTAGAFLENRYVKQLGVMSYSIYLWNNLFFFGPFLKGQALVALVCSISCGALSYQLTEKPLFAFRKRLRPVSP